MDAISSLPNNPPTYSLPNSRASSTNLSITYSPNHVETYARRQNNLPTYKRTHPLTHLSTHPTTGPTINSFHSLNHWPTHANTPIIHLRIDQPTYAPINTHTHARTHNHHSSTDVSIIKSTTNFPNLLATTNPDATNPLTDDPSTHSFDH